MSAEWFYIVDGRNKTGPVSTSQLRALAAEKRLRPTDQVWKEGMTAWIPASKLKGLFAADAVQAVAQPAPRPFVTVTPVRPKANQVLDAIPLPDRSNQQERLAGGSKGLAQSQTGAAALEWYQTKGFLLTAVIAVAFVFVMGAVVFIVVGLSRPQVAPVAQNNPVDPAVAGQQPVVPIDAPPPNQAPMAPAIPAGQNNAGGPYLKQAMFRVTNIAAEAKRIVGFGYNDGISIMAAWVGSGKSVSFGYDLKAGVDYILLAAGDNDAQIIDLEILDARTGQRLIVDESVQPHASVLFQPAYSGKYTLKLTLVASANQVPCICSMVVLRQDGGVAPFQNIDTATFALADGVADLNRTLGPKLGRRFDFRNAPNQWAVYGGVLNQGSELTVVNMDLGFGERLFLGVCDGRSNRLDLSLGDQNGRWIDAPVDVPHASALVQKVAGRGYSLRLRNSSSPRGASVVMMAVLDVH